MALQQAELEVFGVEVTERFGGDDLDRRRWQGEHRPGLPARQHFPRGVHAERRACAEGLVCRGRAIAVVWFAEKQTSRGEGGDENVVPFLAFQRDETAPKVASAVPLVNPGADGQILGGHVFGGARGVGGGVARFDRDTGFVVVADAGGEYEFPRLFVIERVGVRLDAVGEELVVGFGRFGGFLRDFGGDVRILDFAKPCGDRGVGLGAGQAGGGGGDGFEFLENGNAMFACNHLRTGTLGEEIHGLAAGVTVVGKRQEQARAEGVFRCAEFGVHHQVTIFISETIVAFAKANRFHRNAGCVFQGGEVEIRGPAISREPGDQARVVG